MSDNMDIALNTLAQEVNELETSRQTDNKSKMVAMGYKLIAIRELLREKNGVCLNSKLDDTGNKAPFGWAEWVKENLTINPSHASKCIKLAINPSLAERHKIQNRNSETKPTKPLSYIRRLWPTWTEEQRQFLINGVLEIARG